MPPRLIGAMNVFINQGAAEGLRPGFLWLVEVNLGGSAQRCRVSRNSGCAIAIGSDFAAARDVLHRTAHARRDHYPTRHPSRGLPSPATDPCTPTACARTQPVPPISLPPPSPGGTHHSAANVVSERNPQHYPCIAASGGTPNVNRVLQRAEPPTLTHKQKKGAASRPRPSSQLFNLIFHLSTSTS